MPSVLSVLAVNSVLLTLKIVFWQQHHFSSSHRRVLWLRLRRAVFSVPSVFSVSLRKHECAPPHPSRKIVYIVHIVSADIEKTM